MRSVFLMFIVCAFFQLQTSAQGLGKIHYGIKGGYNYISTAYSAAKTTGAHGGYAGVMMKIPFDNRLFFTPQVDFNFRGMNTNALPPNQFSKVSELQLRVMPLVQIEFKHPDKKENTLFISLGPSLGFGIAGNQIKQDGNGVPIEGKLKYGFQQYGQYDASWHTGIGYETNKGLRLLLDYGFGLSSMVNTNFGPLLKYRTISLGAGYWFGKKK